MASEYGPAVSETSQTAVSQLLVDHEELHKAALDDKHFEVSSILKQDLPRAVDRLKTLNTDGFSVLQAASKVNSFKSIEEISLSVEQEDFVECVTQLSAEPEGESSLHIAAIEDNSAAFHVLLRNIKDNRIRRQVLATRNSSGFTAQQTVDKMNRPYMKRLIQYHDMIARGNFKEFFMNFEYSLFTVKLTSERIEINHTKLYKEDCSRDDLGIVRRANNCAVICLQKKDLVNAEHFTTTALERDKYNIHTWCNQGMLLLMQDAELSRVQHAAFQVLDLMSEFPDLTSEPTYWPRIRSKIDYAYWLAESERSEEARETSCKLFDECLQKIGQTARLRHYCSYYYLKILVRFVKSDSKYDKGRHWVSSILDKAVDQLIELHGSTEKEYLGDMWLWLCELQCSRIAQDYWQELSEKFHRATEIQEQCTPETCLNKAIEVAEKIESDKKFLARIAKNCLDCAYRCERKDDRIHWFEKALEISDKWMQDNGWLFMCASTCTQALVQLWSIELYTTKKEFVENCYRHYNHRQDIESEQVVWRYLIDYFYSTDVSEDECTLKYLAPAKKHLADLVLQQEGWASHGVKFARIKFLLGDPEDEIKEAFRKAIYHRSRGVRQAKAYEQFGYFFGITRRTEEAKMLFNLAQEECKGIPTYRLDMAIKGLRMIRSNSHF